MKRRPILLALLAGLAVSACASGMAGIDPEEPPRVRLVVDGSLVEGQRDSYCWTGGPAGGACKDWPPPEFEEACPLVAGEPIRLQLDAPYPHWVSLALGDDLLDETYFAEMMRGAETLEWNVPATPGTYVLVVSASWERQGSVTYLFDISVE
jgi:hypothetical protein